MSVPSVLLIGLPPKCQIMALMDKVAAGKIVLHTFQTLDEVLGDASGVTGGQGVGLGLSDAAAASDSSGSITAAGKGTRSSECT